MFAALLYSGCRLIPNVKGKIVCGNDCGQRLGTEDRRSEGESQIIALHLVDNRYFIVIILIGLICLMNVSRIAFGMKKVANVFRMLS